MRELSVEEIQCISGAKPKFLNVISGSLFSAITGAFVGFFSGGPTGAIAGAAYGAYMGAASATIREADVGLSEVLHPELDR